MTQSLQKTVGRHLPKLNIHMPQYKPAIPLPRDPTEIRRLEPKNMFKNFSNSAILNRQNWQHSIAH